ncbi:PmoA family protein [Candidatus Poribacteria bacterium]|nr:PmoA family protein [Candidatus Poribacteria bacterium]
MNQNRNAVIVKVEAGAIDRHNDLIRFPFKPKDYFSNWQEGTSTLAVSRTDADGHSLREDVPAQFEPSRRELAWQTEGLRAGESAWYAIRATNEPPPNNRYRIENRTTHLLITVDDDLFTRYNFLGVWKPYFWPLNGNHGTVVRGAGGGDHPHHTGLFLAYGGHGEGGSANIWSDWDEPPYGPCGKMLHQRFVRLTQGPVYAEFVEDLVYVKGNGDEILTETRTARAWHADNGRRFLDITHETSPPLDIGDRQFLFVARMNPSMKLPNEGHVENSEGQIGRKEVHHQRARWCDLAGVVGDGVNGLAMFDHPQNVEHPGFFGEIAVPQQMSILHHPPNELSDDRFRLQFRVYVHEGITPEADVEPHYQCYANPVKVEVISTPISESPTD